MKQKLSIITFIIGLVLVVLSFGLRESYEKDMYQVYIKQQKDSLVKGWNKNWQDYLTVNYQVDRDKNAVVLNVDRNGKLLDKEFFPSNGLKESNWKPFKSLSEKDQIEFLTLQLKKKGTWDKAIAVKRILKLKDGAKFLDSLSLYEQTLIDKEKRNSVKLIFDQIKKSSDFSNIEESFSFDLVLLRSKVNGEVSLIVPSNKFLLKNIFRDFKKINNVTEVELSDSPFKIQIKEGFNPFKFNSVREKSMMGLGFVLLFIAVGLYLIELKSKRLEVLKKVSFLNQLVHEVKTPITGIRLNSELLLRHGHDEELVTALLKSSKRLNDFFEDIILINRDDQKINLSKMSNLEFAEYLNEIISEFRGQIELNLNVDCNVCVDKRRLRVVLRNLLKNAVRYGRKGTLDIVKESSVLVIKVQDEGPGVSTADSSKIFDEFYRAQSAKNTSPDGLGIGLSIVQNLVIQMNGSIELLNPGQEHALFQLRIENNES